VRKDPFGIRSEMGAREALNRADVIRLASARVDPDEFLGSEGYSLSERLPVRARRPPDRNDSLAIRAPGRLLIERTLDGQRPRCPSRCTHPPKVSAVLEVEVHERDPLPVGGPHGRVLIPRQVAHLSRSPVRKILDVEPTESRECKAASIRRRHAVPNLLHRERRPVLDGIREVHLRPHRHLDVGLERNLDRILPVDRNPPELSAVSRDELTGIRGESHARIGVPSRARLLIVPLDGKGQPALLVRPQVADAQPRVPHLTRAVHQPPPVRRNDRAEGASESAREGPALPRIHVMDRQLVLPHR
jgi:hypothetical protein